MNISYQKKKVNTQKTKIKKNNAWFVILIWNQKKRVRISLLFFLYKSISFIKIFYSYFTTISTFYKFCNIKMTI